MEQSTSIQVVEKEKIMNIDEIMNNPREYEGYRVVTFKDIDLLHRRPEGTAKRNFTANKKHFIEYTDYFLITAKSVENAEKYEIRSFEIPPRGLIVLTETGYLMLVKSFTDDLAWQIQRELVTNYFRVRKVTGLAKKVRTEDIFPLDLGAEAKKRIERVKKELTTLEILTDIVDGRYLKREKEMCRKAMTVISCRMGVHINDLSEVYLDK